MNKRRVAIVAGNWKMNTTLGEARSLAQGVRAAIGGAQGVTVILCPPFISLAAVADEVRGSDLHVAAQNMHPEAKGAFTGEVAPTMLQDVCEYVVIGHSERRAYFKEADDFINKKVKAALAHNLRPILCVGETLEEREAGRTAQVLERQTRGGLEGIVDLSRVVVAYEPVWAIGTGRAATPEDANQGNATVRRTVASIAGAEAAQRLPILYGGSVTGANAASLFAQDEVDGGLVGGASLRAEEFATIVRAAGAQKARM